jgi:hypothetical protein
VATKLVSTLMSGREYTIRSCPARRDLVHLSQRSRASADARAGQGALCGGGYRFDAAAAAGGGIVGAAGGGAAGAEAPSTEVERIGSGT